MVDRVRGCRLRLLEAATPTAAVASRHIETVENRHLASVITWIN
jgi:hypothetical protein